MSGITWLDGAAQAVSLFNTFTLLWLGLTVLLNASAAARGSGLQRACC